MPMEVYEFYLNSSNVRELYYIYMEYIDFRITPMGFFCCFPHEHLNTAYLLLQFQVRKELVGYECLAPHIHSLASISFVVLF